MAFLAEFLVDGDMSLQLPFLLLWTTDGSFRRSSVGDVRMPLPPEGSGVKTVTESEASRPEGGDGVKRSRSTGFLAHLDRNVKMKLRRYACSSPMQFGCYNPANKIQEQQIWR